MHIVGLSSEHSTVGARLMHVAMVLPSYSCDGMSETISFTLISDIILFAESLVESNGRAHIRVKTENGLNGDKIAVQSCGMLTMTSAK